ncbi:MAG: ATP-binding cassette domain-containing protein [Desulfurivibrio sp.]|nr:ATP-binding cassette domain-containing protein [Desulfurivibrio sp.]
MALVSLQQISLAYGGHPLFDQLNLQIENGERLCLLGRNGEGKSTLMRLLNDEIEPDAGEVIRARGLRSARLEQEVPAGLTGTVAAVAAAGQATPPEPQHLAQVLNRLKLPPEADFNTLSGGLKRRVLLARALANEPQLLLLDEPTNHLDLAAIHDLEELLLGFKGALLFVTHDRRLVRRLATRIIELDRGQLSSWPGNYDNYLRRREEQLAAEENANARFDRKLAAEEAWIRQGVKARRTRNQGRVEALQQMRQQRATRREQSGKARMRLQDGAASGRLVAKARDVSFHWPDGFPVVEQLSTTIMRGDKVGIIGPNGIGKTTLLKLLLGQLAPLSGDVRLGTNLEICYFDQHREQLDPERSVADNLADGQDTVQINGQSRHIMGYLQDFLFTPQRARSPVKILSGGEKNRLLLARLFARPCNVLVMDEPTNDLDIETLELLEELLLDFRGTLLLVSHDRDFLNNVVTSTLVCEGHGRVVEYAGGYDDWLRQRDGGREASTGNSAPKKHKGGGKNERRQPQPAPAGKQNRLTFTEAHELKELPGLIEKLEAQQQELLAVVGDPEFHRRPATEITAHQAQIEDTEAKLNQAYQRWQELEQKEN